MVMLRGWDEGYETPSFGIIIHPTYRNRGFGKEMLISAIDYCRKEKCKKIRLTVDKDNIVAKKMYLKAGFKFKGNVGFKNL